jgi:adenylate kinase
MKRVILITGTPAVGKTTTATALAAKLDAAYINLTDFAKEHNLTLGEDTQRGTLIVNDKLIQVKLAEAIAASEKKDIIIDGHYAAAVTPHQHVSHVFVLRRHPRELKQFMEQKGYRGSKMWENLQAEIIDICLGEAVETYPEKVCELDVTSKTTQKIVEEIVAVLDKRKTCISGLIDWMSTLEREGVLDEYLKL